MATDLHLSRHPAVEPPLDGPRGVDHRPVVVRLRLLEPHTERATVDRHRRWALGSALTAGGVGSGFVANLILIAAAATVAVSAVIHLHLWNAGYRHLPTVGPLFLLQAVSGFVLSALLILTRRVWAAVLSFGLVAATLVGFIMAIYVGLFGFRDSWSAPFAGMAFTYEVVSGVLLVVGSTLCVIRQRRQA
jgi:hypothetical protein